MQEEYILKVDFESELENQKSNAYLQNAFANLLDDSGAKYHNIDPEKTHKFYWEKAVRRAKKPIHPGENDFSLPVEIRGKHFESWTDLAGFMGYGK